MPSIHPEGDPFIRAHWRVMLVFLFVFGVVMGACYKRPENYNESTGIGYYHDDAHGVSCWLWGNGGGSNTAAISCLPDSEVRH